MTVQWQYCSFIAWHEQINVLALEECIGVFLAIPDHRLSNMAANEYRLSCLTSKLLPKSRKVPHELQCRDAPMI